MLLLHSHRKFLSQSATVQKFVNERREQKGGTRSAVTHLASCIHSRYISRMQKYCSCSQGALSTITSDLISFLLMGFQASEWFVEPIIWATFVFNLETGYSWVRAQLVSFDYLLNFIIYITENCPSNRLTMLQQFVRSIGVFNLDARDRVLYKKNDVRSQWAAKRAKNVFFRDKLQRCTATVTSSPVTTSSSHLKQWMPTQIIEM